MIRHSWAAALALVAATTLTACGGSDTAEDTSTSQSSSSEESQGGPSQQEFDDFVASAESQMNSTMGDAFKDIYSDIRIESMYPDGITYVYVYKQEVDPDFAVEQLETQIPVLRASFRSQVKPELQNQLGIEDPVVSWRYLQPDETLIWEHTEPQQ